MTQRFSGSGRAWGRGLAMVAGIGLLSPALPGGNAVAAPRYQKADAAIEATQTERSLGKKQKEQKPSGPMLQEDEFSEKRHGAVVKITDDIIRKARMLADATPDTDPEKPDLLFRIAELFAEKTRGYSMQAGSMDQKIFEAEQRKDGGAAQRLRSEQETLRRAEKEQLLEAAKWYISVVNNPKFRNYQRMDEVLFYLAYMLQQVKRDDDARKFFLRLVKEYPQSRFVPEAYLSFGEYYFARGEMENAKAFYDKVTQFPEAKAFGFAMYKKAWCFYNLGNFQESLASFVKVLRYSKQMPARAAKDQLVRETKKDLVVAYSRFADTDKAWVFFQRVGEEMAPKMLEILAGLYNEQGKFVDSIKTYRKLMSLFQNSPKFCSWQYKVAENAQSAGNKNEQVVELRRLANVYEALRDGKLGKDVKKGDIDQCRADTADTLRELATVWHREGIKTQNNETLARARALYTEYLEKFKGEKDEYKMTFYFAELLWKLEKWETSAEMYTKVVKLDPKGPHTKESALAAVLGWKNALNVDDNPPEEVDEKCQQAENAGKGKKGKKGKKRSADAEPDPGAIAKACANRFKPKELTPPYVKMMAAYDTYLQYVPDAPELPTIKYRKAKTFYDFNQFEKAIPLFAEVVDKHSKSNLAVVSATFLLDSLNALGKPEEIPPWIEKFVSNPELMKDTEFATQIKNLKAESMWLIAQGMSKQGRHREAAIAYRDMYNAAPTHPRGAQMLYNCALEFEEAGIIGGAVSARKALIEERPDDVLAKKAQFQIAGNYHGLAYYEKAADFYEKFAKKFPGEADSIKALGTAVFFRRGLGQDEKAIEDNHDFVKYYGSRKPQEAARVFFSIGAIYEKNKQWGKLVSHMEEYSKRYGSKGPKDLEILAQAKLGETKWRQSCPLGEGVNGACIKLERTRAGGKAGRRAGKGQRGGKRQCGPDTKARITIVARAKKVAADAQKHFSKVLALYGKGNALRSIESDNRKNDVVYAAAQARFAQAEQKYEEFLAVKFPEGLDFNPAKKKKAAESIKKFNQYNTDKMSMLVETQKVYQEVITFKQAHWAIAGSARIGQVFADYANQLFTAEIPGILKQDWEKDLYCDALQDKADPVEAKAKEGFETCMGKSTELSWFNEWSTLCEVELNQLEPSKYPLASEMRVQPGYIAASSSSSNVITDLR